LNGSDEFVDSVFSSPDWVRKTKRCVNARVKKVHLSAWVRQLSLYIRVLVLATVTVVSGVQAQTINPTGRVLTLQTPLELNGSIVGNLLTTIDQEDSISFETNAIIAFLADRVSPALQSQLAVFEEKERITSEDLASIGIVTSFDMGSLGIALKIPTDQLRERVITLREQRSVTENLAEPTSVSGYMNLRGLLSRRSTNQSDNASVDSLLALDGKIRFAGPVLDFAFELSDREGLASTSGLDRQYTRLIIDRPGTETRMTFGDIEIGTGVLTGSTPLVGFSIQRDYALTPNRIVKPTGQRKFSLARPSTVTLVANGRRLRSFNLAAGNYDISDIPLAEGYNNLVLEVEDETGKVEEIDFSTLFTSDLLATGEIDYAFSAGWLSTFEAGELRYRTDEFVTSGLIRYGALDSLTLGHSLQLSDSLAIIETDGVMATRLGPWSSAIGLSLADDREVGWAVSTAIANNASANIDRFRWNAGFELRGRKFRPSPGNFSDSEGSDGNTVSGFLGFSTSLARRKQFDGVFNYFSRDGENRSTITATLSGDLSFGRGLYWLVRLRHEKSDTEPESNNVTLAFNYQFDREQRIDSLFSNAGPFAEVGATRKSNPGLVGGYSLDFVSRIEADEKSLSELAVNYTANRFEGQVSHNVQTLLENDVESAVTTARLSTSLVVAAGKIAISRPITDSFAIVETHTTLGDRRLRLSPTADSELARSDWLGSAVIPNLGLYENRSISYNVDDLPIGYDLGTGVFFVAPPRGGGYKLKVGSAAVITVIGTLVDAKSGEAITLTSGTASSTSESSLEPVVFFTNRTGKFALSGVAPGEYSVELNGDSVRRFKLVVPEDSTTLYRTGTISVP